MPAIERVNAGNVLDKLSDDRFNKAYFYLPDDSMLGFVEIPEGEFIMGSDKDKDKDADADDDESPQHNLDLDTFYISKYPVTVSQYKVYLKSAGKSVAEDWHQYNRFNNHPVVYVSWFNAMEYCKWLSAELRKNKTTPKQIKDLLNTEKWHLTLLSEAEWEKAARGLDGRIYPWGNTFDKDRLNFYDTNIGRPSPVGCFEKGASPYQVVEMSGNVFEWTKSKISDYPCQPNEERLHLTDKSEARVVRGGSWDVSARCCRVAYRYEVAPNQRFSNIGFRVCLSFEESIRKK
ncbi:MAG: hypothetical protein OMM_05379 [Candidatus Magnetoglobus multicellularis str. Araruama]|uniref:Sulfatase-modifying factor enzyme-like domain-containing protein n=1 Tax=Candidatus Magnetoglobus multicellularis str. Araruama TaxID=890399 RepID=A0A1V1NWR8_9BACT|nr:MAG: hypothetical protein OMM_05379 [Candidatus Magnetoglobus multicellularis str. Araruama]